MNRYRIALCWAAAILGVAVAGSFEVLDGEAISSLLIGLFVVGPMMACDRPSRPSSQRAGA